MNVLQVFNQYRSRFNGEESVVHQTVRLIERHGGRARLLMRSSRDIRGWGGKLSAFASGIYSRQAYRDMRRTLREDRPDVVHVHNLYPLFSPSVLVACRREGVPVVASVHNQQLTCPTADHLSGGAICTRCLDGSPIHCALQNCRQNRLESLAYAARSAVARRMRLFHDNVARFIALGESARQRLIRGGYPGERIVVLPNMVAPSDSPADPAAGQYAVFAGRLSPEKGIATLIEAARTLPGRPLHLAGDGPQRAALERGLPGHVKLLGRLDPSDMHRLYRGARFLVLPSQTFEMCPLVILEAMSHGVPVIATRHGGQADLVDEGRTGLLFASGDSDELARQMHRLWDDDQLCRRLGRAAYETVRRQHSEPIYYRRLIEIYQSAIRDPEGKLLPEHGPSPAGTPGDQAHVPSAQLAPGRGLEPENEPDREVGTPPQLESAADTVT